jgi:DNA-binding response OmpR family regulator
VTTILVLDDDPTLRELVARMLRVHGYSTRTASTPIMHPYDGVDVTVSDWEMPDGGGERVLREATCPVVIMTGRADVVAMLHARGQAAIAKPFALHELLDAVAKATANEAA